MSYLYVCTTHKVELVHYDARTECYLKLNSDGAGSFSHAFIYPRVTIGFGADVQLAKDLHKKASQLCFISNSLNFKVEIFPEIIQKQEKVV
jgi:organic hydroperoxide reductase OsmC/OhrA